MGSIMLMWLCLFCIPQSVVKTEIYYCPIFASFFVIFIENNKNHALNEALNFIELKNQSIICGSY